MSALVAFSGRAWAGPPFLTDDPEPVDLHHWEIYGAFQWTWEHGAATGTLPHVEVNYGAAPELQLHVIAPAVLAWKSGPGAQYGPGDVELGAKLRFVDETTWRPQIGTFPLIELPIGSATRGTGTGELQVLLPIWLQKSFGRFTTYGGGGVLLSPSGHHAVVLGWLLQRQLVDWLTLGVEVHYTAPLDAEASLVQLNLGAIVDISPHHHVLLSAGPAFGVGPVAQSYAAYQLTF